MFEWLTRWLAALLLGSLSFIVVPMITSDQGTDEPFPTVIPTAIVPVNGVHAQINAAREAAGLPALMHDSRLGAAAYERAAYISEHGLDHQGGQAAYDALERHGVTGQWLGENLAQTLTIENAVPLWLQSPTHAAIILNVGFTRVGIASVKGHDSLWFTVAIFLEP